MKLRMHQLDAFTNRVFGGNPAAVVLLERPLPDGLLQAIATENNLSETAFLLPEADRLRLRWFTPRSEVDLCGHATLATAHVLFVEQQVRGHVVHFETQSGTVTVTRTGERLALDFPARPPEPAEAPEGLVAALGAEPREVLRARDLLAVFESEEEIAALRPDTTRLEGVDAWAVCATAPGREVDFVSRFFAPRVGIPEDPVTGSSHCSLIPFWAERLGKKALRARQLSARGGELDCELRGDRVAIGGQVVEYLRGEIEVEEPE